MQNGFVLENADGENIARAILEIRKDEEKSGMLAMGAVGFFRSELSGIKPEMLMSFYTINLKKNRNER